MSQVDVDVAVVGLGPVGAVLTALLGQQGVATLALDKLDAIYALPRAVAFDHEVMRVIQSLGLAERIAPYVVPYRPTEYRGLGGVVIARYDSMPPPYPQGWAPNYVFNQPKFEQIIRERLAELPSSRVKLATELRSLKRYSDRVELSVLTPSGGIEKLCAQYVVGCDGGASFVRKELGVQFESLDFDEPWLVVDVLVGEESLAKLPQTMVQYCDPARPTTYVVGPGNHRRWEIMLSPDEEPDQINQPEAIWRLLSRWLQPSEGVLWRAATYVFHALVAREWRKGRVLLAGDAAHMTPPFMAQGMCQGIRDAANLAWKLGAVIRKEASDVLLDSYQDERRPHVLTTTSTAKALGRVICERDPKKALERDREMLATSGDPPALKYRQDLLPPLQAGALMVEQGMPVGTLIPQPKIRVGGGLVLMDDFVRPELRLITSNKVEEIPLALRETLRSFRGVIVKLENDGLTRTSNDFTYHIVESDGLLSSWLKKCGAKAVLVRPDNYVFGVVRQLRDMETLEIRIRELLFRPVELASS